MKKNATILAALLLGACATADDKAEPRDMFFERLSALCGKAFEGRIASPAVPADAAFAGKRLVMHVRACSDERILIPFHVGEDRSRTWVISRTGAGLRLKHDHRHEDGSEDRLTQYGGDSDSEGTARRRQFPADAFSKALFEREGSTQSVTNVWAVEVEPETLFAYELRRPGRFFRVEFDLTKPVASPPPPWGAH